MDMMVSLPVRTGVQSHLISDLPRTRAFGRDRYPRLVLTIKNYLVVINYTNFIPMNSSIVGDFDEECILLSKTYSDDGNSLLCVEASNNPKLFSIEIIYKLNNIIAEFWDLNPIVNSILLNVGRLGIGVLFTNATSQEDIVNIDCLGEYFGKKKSIWTIQFYPRDDVYDIEESIKNQIGKSRFKKINLKSLILIDRLLQNGYASDSIRIVCNDTKRVLITRDTMHCI
jgi:hypothetical protein